VPPHFLDLVLTVFGEVHEYLFQRKSPSSSYTSLHLMLDNKTHISKYQESEYVIHENKRHHWFWAAVYSTSRIVNRVIILCLTWLL
jgi:SET domain-containing protein